MSVCKNESRALCDQELRILGGTAEKVSARLK